MGSNVPYVFIHVNVIQNNYRKTIYLYGIIVSHVSFEMMGQTEQHARLIWKSWSCETQHV